MYVNFRELKNGEEGQDLVEYALVVALIAFPAVVGMGKFSSAINTAYSNLSTRLGGAVT
jgi:pilus assembly protein Flp/PilA